MEALSLLSSFAEHHTIGAAAFAPLQSQTRTANDFASMGSLRHRPLPRDVTAWNSTAVIIALEQQVADALACSSGTLPPALLALLESCRHLVPLSERKLLLKFCAFGSPRTLQEMQEMDRSYNAIRRGEAQAAAASSADTDVIVRVACRHPPSQAAGRLQRDRVTIRRDSLYPDALSLMKLHCQGINRRAQLEVQFDGDNGSGIGVTREFFAKVAELLMARSWDSVRGGDHVASSPERGSVLPAKGATTPLPFTPLWHDDDTLGASAFIMHHRGLFPRVVPTEPRSRESVLQRFEFLGRLVGVALQDHRTLPLPLSLLFIEALQRCIQESCGDGGSAAFTARYVTPHKGNTLLLSSFALSVMDAYYPSTRVLMDAATGAAAVDVDAMCLEFVDPVSGAVLRTSPGSIDAEAVTAANISDYVKALAAFVTRDGIAPCLVSVMRGVGEILDPRRLLMFSPRELREMVCGHMDVLWTAEELGRCLKCSGAYNPDSPSIRALVQVSGLSTVACVFCGHVDWVRHGGRFCCGACALCLC